MFRTYHAVSDGSSRLTALFSGPGALFTERVIAQQGAIVRVQTEQRGGLVFMRAKKRVLYRDDLREK